jgi:signal transduction histidine kinase/ActR/RegA family two-component response regulator
MPRMHPLQSAHAPGTRPSDGGPARANSTLAGRTGSSGRLDPRAAGYGFAVLSTLIVLLARWLLWPLLGDTSPFVLFFLSVLITARYYGPGPGALATVLGAASGFYLFTQPRYTFILGEPRDMVRLVLFLLVAAGTNWMAWLRWRSDEALRRSSERLQYLLEIARDLLVSDQPAGYVETLYRRLASILGLDLYLFHMTGADGEMLRLQSHDGLPARVLQEMEELPASQTLLADAASSGRGSVVPGSSDSRDPHAVFARSSGVAAYAVYPLIAHEHLVGSLAFGSRARPPFDPDELALMQTVCDQVAVAVDRARLISELRDRAKELAEGDRHKNEFLAMLAHELRNPLAPIRTAVEVMRLRDSDREALKRNRGVLDRQVTHMGRLLDDLLDMSRISRGKVRLRKERVELGPVLEGAIEASAPMIAQRGHDLTVSLPAQPAWVDADVTRLHQVVTNLLTNAAKYTDPGGRIELSAWREGDEVAVRVTDTGIGIKPEMLPRVFDLFSQAERALNRSEGGLGIGLSLVRSLVEMHGGSVLARSEGLGCGSQFTVCLPVVEAPAALKRSRTEEQEATPAAAAAPVPAARPTRVLVVDDSRDAAETLAELLELWGFEPVTAPDGEAGLEILRSTRPQTVLLDVGLPGMDGYELAQRIRREPGGDGMLLVALTGYGQEEDRQRSREAGIDFHLTKPVDMGHLHGLLMRDAPSPPQPRVAVPNE